LQSFIGSRSFIGRNVRIPPEENPSRAIIEWVLLSSRQRPCCCTAAAGSTPNNSRSSDGRHEGDGTNVDPARAMEAGPFPSGSKHRYVRIADVSDDALPQ
jgi:hypothetical protein